ncbi:hypothetical protein [Streptomyces sp. OE57]|uniref:hypothetical protein n=1 Tax=Streptomyces lacaronensis TaxID=3379885 RepID=UPI0039B73F96
MTAKAQAAQPSLRTTVRDPRRGSRSSLPWTLRLHAPLSRQELVRRTGLGATTEVADTRVRVGLFDLALTQRAGAVYPLASGPHGAETAVRGAEAPGRAEMWFGAGRGVQHAVVALIGSGVSASVITHGSPHAVALGAAALSVRHFLTEGAHRPARRPTTSAQGALTRPPPVCRPPGALTRAAAITRMPVP